jgi:multidrug efflux system membrane fusion protein
MVAQVKIEPTPVVLQDTGIVRPDAMVAVKPRIDGQIDKVLIADAADVTAGQLLFTLDDRQYRVAVDQAAAQLARDRATFDEAKREWDRFSALKPDEEVSRQQLDQTRATLETAAASVKGDEAALANAQVLLTYTHIEAPIDGRAGFIALKRGNVVHTADAAPLVVINRIHPVQVAFSVPQKNLADIRAAMNQGALAVSVTAQSGPVIGRLAYIDNAVDSSTGTIGLRALFDNTDNRLWPGEVLEATLTLRTEAGALVVPAQAVQQGQNGAYVWVIRRDQTAEARPVKVDRTIGNASVLASGVAAGDTVVVDGAMRLADGIHVQTRPMAETAALAATAVKAQP